MLFKPYLVTEILAGRKTATRRDWKRPHAKVGGTYPVQARMYQPRSECPIIECTALYRQTLKDMTEADARAEGVEDLAEFKRIWNRDQWRVDPREGGVCHRVPASLGSRNSGSQCPTNSIIRGFK